MAWDVVHGSDLEWEERPAHEGQEPRHAAALTELAHMTESRARMWRYPAHTRGRRHLDPDQEEVFVPLRGTLTMLLGEPGERVDVSRVESSSSTGARRSRPATRRPRRSSSSPTARRRATATPSS